MAGEPRPDPPAPLAFPTDPRDGWEPGAPELRSLVPSAIGGGVVPVAVYFAVRPAFRSDAPALALAGVPAAAWVALGWVRRHRVDPIGMITLVGFVAGLLASAALGGNAFVLKVRDSAFTAALGLACLTSLVARRRPVMFFLGRALSAGDDPERLSLYDELWTLAPARAMFRFVTLLWGVGLLVEAAARVVLAVSVPTGAFVVCSPVLAAVVIGGLTVFTVWFTRFARRRVEGQVVPDVPAGGGGVWFWTAVWLRGGPRPAPAAAAVGEGPAGR